MGGSAMRKIILPLIAACLVLTACSKGPKDAVIPSDMKEWSQLDDKVKQLSDDDRRLFATYMMRVGIAGALKGEGVPAGMTIGQAIEAQRKFEADKKAQADKESALQAKVMAQRNAAIERMNQVVTFAIVSMEYTASDPVNGVMSDKETFSYAVKNSSDKDIAGLKGTATFTDMFGQDIYTMNVQIDQGIPAQSEQTLDGFEMELSQVNDDDMNLARATLDKVKVTFTPTMIVYADGSKDEAPAE